MKHFARLLLVAGTTTALAACQTTSTEEPTTTHIQANKEQRLETALEKAAIAASKNGSQTARLIALEKQYKRNSTNAIYALSYAQGLRQANFLNKAAMVLEPFAEKEESNDTVKTEMSMIQLALGNYDSAEKYAQNAILQNPKNYQAYQNLGIALDAKEMHPEAERAFRKSMEYWKGDPTAVMNNLALNLATQGFIDEAIEVLERAKALSPDRIELERNLRIIRTLNER